MGRRLRDDEVYEHFLSDQPLMDDIIGAYAMGRRTSGIVEVLARAKVAADNIGAFVPLPTQEGWTRTLWDLELDMLVSDKLGDLRCLNCWDFYRDTGYRGTVGFGSDSVSVPRCPRCGGTLSEPIGVGGE